MGVVKVLLQSNADVNSINVHGRTPLFAAAMKGHEAVVKLMLETGQVDVDLQEYDNGRSPLSFAARCGHEGVVRRLRRWTV